MKTIKFILFLTVGVLLICGTISAQSDYKIKKISRMNMPGMPAPMKNPMTGEIMDFSKMPDSVVLIKGARMLTEWRKDTKDGKEFISTRVKQCDLGREISYTNKSKKYTVTNFNSNSKTTGTDKSSEKESGGTVIFSITFTDTGERKQMFGYTARRVKSVLVTKPSANACQKKAMKVETDAWYIDLPSFSCPMSAPTEQIVADGEESSCNDKIIYQVNGKDDRGFAVKETMTVTLDGMQPVTMTHEVTEITKTDFDAALFDVPPGYTEDKNSNARIGGASNNSKTSPTTTTSNFPAASMPTVSTNDNESSLKPKKAGVIRIGIAKPNMNLPNSKDDATAPLQLSAAVRDSLMANFKTETVEAIRLETDAPESEAKEKNCDYIFYANVTQKRGGGGMFGKIAAMTAMTAVGMIVPGVGGMIAGTVGNIAMSQTMGKAAKAKDEFTFDYKVTDLNNAVISKALTKAKTKQDGEDVLSPQIKQASDIVLGEIAKKK